MLKKFIVIGLFTLSSAQITKAAWEQPWPPTNESFINKLLEQRWVPKCISNNLQEFITNELPHLRIAPWVPLGLIAGLFANSVLIDKSVDYLEQKNHITAKTSSFIKKCSKARLILLGIYATKLFIHSHESRLSCIECCPEILPFAFLMGLLPLPEITLISYLYTKLTGQSLD